MQLRIWTMRNGYHARAGKGSGREIRGGKAREGRAREPWLPWRRPLPPAGRKHLLFRVPCDRQGPHTPKWWNW